MNNNEFLAKLISQNWQLDKTPIGKTNTEDVFERIKNVTINRNAFERIQKAPKEFVDFILSFSSLENDKQNVWFLSYKEYVDNDEENTFSWNEFEKQSIEAADDDEKFLSAINEYWNNHIPFLMSVEGEYSYVSICISIENYGKIFLGYEPEYEDSTCIAENLFDFFDKFFSLAISK